MSDHTIFADKTTAPGQTDRPRRETRYREFRSRPETKPWERQFDDFGYVGRHRQASS